MKAVNESFLILLIKLMIKKVLFNENYYSNVILLAIKGKTYLMDNQTYILSKDDSMV